jgi:hypothetical protein
MLSVGCWLETATGIRVVIVTAGRGSGCVGVG